MSDNLDSLYGDIIMEHQREPRNRGQLKPCDHTEEGFNPLCGDHVMMTFRFDEKGQLVKEVAFEGEGCSICMASASILMQEIEGMSYQAILDKISDFRALMQGENIPAKTESDVQALSGVRRFPVRIKCALLPWMTVKKVMDEKMGVK